MKDILTKTPEQQINDDYDAKLVATLQKRLNREPKDNEKINADFDSDLVNEILWQLIVKLNERVSILEKKNIKDVL